ncbi:hypothetical protein [Granulicella arctica]|uniref:VapC45 PIN like domain-containing protein n=1 Tax=Granulicella arctica TaxID=940613 RepID=A0A7Y9PFS8_9BACT|nr:hypothetical protein [Granulicella arctica]NYF79118.1 hypothetical protein [Granulicella arctica]
MGDEPIEGGIAEFVVFLDENHCRNPHLVAALVSGGVSLERHLDHFAQGIPDIEWLPVIAQRGWVLLTADARIRRKSRINMLERRAVGEYQLRMFYFSTNQSSGREMGDTLRRALPKMKAICDAQAPPFTASINKAGEVTLRDTSSSFIDSDD